MYVEQGISGGKTSDLLAALPSAQSAKANRSVLLMGVNDILQLVPTATTIANITSLLSILPDPRPVCILPFGGYVGWTSDKENARRLLNDFIRTLPNYIDLESILGDGDDDQPRLIPSVDSGDGLHINHVPGDDLAAQGMYDQGNWH